LHYSQKEVILRAKIEKYQVSMLIVAAVLCATATAKLIR